MRDVGISVTSRRVLNLRLTGADLARGIRGIHFKKAFGVSMLSPASPSLSAGLKSCKFTFQVTDSDYFAQEKKKQNKAKSCIFSGAELKYKTYCEIYINIFSFQNK
jgi:hypothetical protein